MTSLDHTLRGLAAGRSGASFERELDLVHDAYRRERVATVQRLPVPTVPMPRSHLSPAGIAATGGSARRLGERQGFDYQGWFGVRGGTTQEPARYRGLAICMEAKANDRPCPSLPIIAKGRVGRSITGKKRNGGGGLKEHQLRALVEAARDGAVACVVWRCGPPDHREPGGSETFRGVLLGPAIIAALEAFEAGGRRSVPRSAFTPYSVLPGTIFEDWLFPVREWMEREGRRAS